MTCCESCAGIPSSETRIFRFSSDSGHVVHDEFVPLTPALLHRTPRSLPMAVTLATHRDGTPSAVQNAHSARQRSGLRCHLHNSNACIFLAAFCPSASSPCHGALMFQTKSLFCCTSARIFSDFSAGTFSNLHPLRFWHSEISQVSLFLLLPNRIRRYAQFFAISVPRLIRLYLPQPPLKLDFTSTLNVRTASNQRPLVPTHRG